MLYTKIKQGITRFGAKGKAAAEKEILQLHNRKVFAPILLYEITSTEKKRAMNSLIFLIEKRDGTIKARACANGSMQRSYVERDKASSPTPSTETLMITSVIEANQRRDVVILDIPNAFVQTTIPESNEETIMRISGHLAELIIELLPQHYEKYLIREGNTKINFVQMLKALYGMMMSSLLFYRHFRKVLESIGFVVNPYDICVANRNVEGTQQTSNHLACR